MILKKFFSFISILFLLSTSSVLSNEKTVFLDIDFILNKSKPAISIIKNIEKIRKKELDKLKSLEKELNKKNEDIKKTKNLISEDELKKKVASFREEVKSFEDLKRKSINEINKKKTQQLNEFLKKINPLLQEYMEKNSIDIVLDKKNVFMAKSQIDITKEILDLINKNIK